MQIELGNDDQGDKDKGKALVFYKIRPDVITPDNVHTNVFISSILDSPLSTLYQSVHNVYVPMLLKDDKLSRGLDPKLQSLLGELDAGLGSVIRKKTDRGTSAKSGLDESLGGSDQQLFYICFLFCLIVFFLFFSCHHMQMF